MGKVTDIAVKIEGVDFMCRSCAVVMHDGKILFQKRRNDKYWALPGGKIEVLETTKEAVTRELKEELDITDITVGDVISVTENFFECNGNRVHQYIFAHKVTFNYPKYNDVEGTFDGSEEGKDVIFTWVKKDDLVNTPIKPDYVVNQLLNGESGIQFSTCIE